MTKAEKDECWRKTVFGLPRTPKEEKYAVKMAAKGRRIIRKIMS